MVEEKINEEQKEQVEIIKETKKNFPLWIVVVIAVLVLGTGWFIFKPKNNNNEVVKGASSTQDAGSTFTMDEISTHNSQQDCWTVIEGNVYDVTSFIPDHPGGERILAACGIDATDLFTGKSPMGRMHSQVARSILSKLQIGTLSK